MLDINRVLKSENKITNDLNHKVFDSIDRAFLILEITLNRDVKGKNKPFVIEKSFRNNYDGNENMQKAIKEFDTEEKVKKYFGLI